MSDARKPITALATCAMLVGALLCAAPALAGEGLGVTATFGSPGSGPGELSLIGANKRGNDEAFGSGLAVNGTGDVYVADTRNDRVEWFNATGKYEGQFNGLEVDGARLGAGEAAPAMLVEPQGIAVDDDPSSASFGDVYVVTGSFGGETIDKFSAGGDFILQLSPRGIIAGIATDASGDVWYVQPGVPDGLVQEFSGAAKNTLLRSLRPPSLPFARGIAVDSEENFYIRESSYQITKFGESGEELGLVCAMEGCVRGLAIDPATEEPFVDQEKSVAQYGPFGEPFGAPVLISRPNILVEGVGIAVSPANHEAYVADAGTNHIVVMAHGPSPQAPETSSATEVKAKSAILHGALKPPAPKLEYYFEYNTGGSCTGGSTTPLNEGEGEVFAEVTELEPSAEYAVCAVAENNFGPSERGSPKTFLTAAAPPEVIGESASIVGEGSGEVTFAATINPDHSSQETTYSFEYSTEASGEELEGVVNTAEGGTIPAEEFGERGITSVPAGVPTKKTVYYRVVASNATGTTKGKVESYTKLPIVDSESAAGVTLTEATLEAKLNPDWQTTTYHFEYASSEVALEKHEGILLPSASTQGKENLFEELSVSSVAYGLRPRTSYYYRLVAENASSENAGNITKGQPVVGAIEHFTTNSLPVPSTGEAQSITRTSAVLAGTDDPVGLAGSYYFQYIDEAGYQAALAQGADPYAAGESTIPVSIPASGETLALHPVPVSGLLPATTYHYRLVAKNQFGAEYGEGHTFTTTGRVLPGASTGAASAVSQNAATLSGTVGTNGLQTNYGFEIGTEPGVYGPTTGLGSIGGSLTETVSVALDELQPATTYYFRVTATNADGTSYGEPASFTTPGFPTLLAPQSEPPLIAIPAIAFPNGSQANSGKGANTGKAKRKLTRAQKLAAAVKACRKDAKKRGRAKCDRQAHKLYGATKKKR
jgi:hypothetical protein